MRFAREGEAGLCSLLELCMTGEGSLDAPTREIIDWQDPDFADPAKLDAEMRRVFDICHGCRRCFNLCDSFPRLFDLIDSSPNEDVEHLKSEDFKPVVEACTLCDMCFMTKCPYVPPHPFMLDFPHLMLRHRSVEAKEGPQGFHASASWRRWTATAPWRASRRAVDQLGVATKPTSRRAALMEKTAGISTAKATLPKFHSRTFVSADQAASRSSPTRQRPAFGKRKAALYATCFVNYNKPRPAWRRAPCSIISAWRPKSPIPAAAACRSWNRPNWRAWRRTPPRSRRNLVKLIDEGYDIVALTASCGLMLKFEWALICPDNEDVKRVADNVFDIDEYVVDVAKKEGLPDGPDAAARRRHRASGLSCPRPEYGPQGGGDAEDDSRTRRWM